MTIFIRFIFISVIFVIVFIKNSCIFSDGTVDDGTFDQSEQKTLAGYLIVFSFFVTWCLLDEYEYVMHGKIFKIKQASELSKL
jgi:hypothetical protein